MNLKSTLNANNRNFKPIKKGEKQNDTNLRKRDSDRTSDSGAKISVGSLFSFERFITPTIIKIIYIVGLVIIPLAMIGSVAAMFLFALFKSAGAAFILPAFFQLIVGIVTSLIAILMLRIYCECISVLFQVSEDLQILKRKQGINL